MRSQTLLLGLSFLLVLASCSTPPLVAAAKQGDVRQIETLITQHEDVECRSGGLTPLMWASQEGHSSAVQVLLNHGADINAQTFDNNSALLWALLGQHFEVAKMLVLAGAEPNVLQTRFNKTPLMFAVQRENVELVRALLIHGADPNTRGDHQHTALIHAAQFDAGEETIRLLLEHRAEVDVADADGQSVLYIAAWRGNLALAKTLLGRGAKICVFR